MSNIEVFRAPRTIKIGEYNHSSKHRRKYGVVIKISTEELKEYVNNQNTSIIYNITSIQKAKIILLIMEVKKKTKKIQN